MNETWLGLSADGNLESIDVFASWRNDENERRVADEVEYFDNLWHDHQPGVTVTPFPEVVQQELLEIADELHWEDYVDEICQEIETDAGVTADHRLGTRTPRPHQVAALDAWEQRGRRGILEHATGSGKTFTALCAIHESLVRGEIPLVLVPSELLLIQWQDELTTTFESQGLHLLVCGGGHRAWGGPATALGFGLATTVWPSLGRCFRPYRPQVQRSSGGSFATGSHLFVVADEVHRTGSPAHRQVLHFFSGPRLGLSATPRRAGDPVGTAALMDYFDGIVPPPFTLQDAIAAGSLTPYSYRPHRVSLDDDEQAAWDRLTAEIGRKLGDPWRGGAGPDR